MKKIIINCLTYRDFFSKLKDLGVKKVIDIKDLNPKEAKTYFEYELTYEEKEGS